MNPSHNMQPMSDHFTNVPAFLIKLWKMVSDTQTNHLICWSPSGKNFIILNQVQFWYELLPLYYKHNNMSSFVRQLNMYGFHKVSPAENDSVLEGEKDEVQFFHANFQKGKPELLKLIKRKVTVSKHAESSNQVLKGEELSKVLSDVKQLRGKQASVDHQLAAMKQENAVLWRELAVLRQKHTKQQQIVNKLIQFLVSMVHPSNNRMGVGVKRHYPLMLRGTTSTKISKNSKNNSKNKNDGPTIHELDNEIEIEGDLGSTLKSDVLLTVPEDEENKDFPLVYSPSTPSSSIGVLSPISNIELTNDLITEAEATSAEKVGGPDENLPSKSTNDLFWEKPPYVFERSPSNELLTDAEIPDDPILNILEDNIVNQEKPDVPYGKGVDLSQCQDSGVGSSMAVATKKPDSNIKLSNSTNDCFSGDFGSILENTQSELDIYKDILHGCGTLDTNALLGVSFYFLFYWYIQTHYKK
ncbi:hypothetical protein WA026_010471 [Henosepilachna vigintioctopunctata]|uniref:HSF-type DNA-binding domain-containing protein n=1 Tax=Henosepilachna vigintioctopunctata TaxID=420089 RepID=A0AAW1VB83_9CUCU